MKTTSRIFLILGILLSFSGCIGTDDVSISVDRELKFDSNDLCKWNGTACTGSRQIGTHYTAQKQTYVIILAEVSGSNKAIDLEIYENGIMMTDHDHLTGSAVADIDDDFHIIVPRGVSYNVSTTGTTATITNLTWYEQYWE